MHRLCRIAGWTCTVWELHLRAQPIRPSSAEMSGHRVFGFGASENPKQVCYDGYAHKRYFLPVVPDVPHEPRQFDSSSGKSLAHQSASHDFRCQWSLPKRQQQSEFVKSNVLMKGFGHHSGNQRQFITHREFKRHEILSGIGHSGWQERFPELWSMG